MKSKLSFILSVLCALLVLTACQAGQAPDPESAEPPAEATEPEAPAPEPEAPADPGIGSRISSTCGRGSRRGIWTPSISAPKRSSTL